MALIKLSGFTPIPEGVYVFRIDAVDYKEAFGKLVIDMVTSTGEKHPERFYFIDKDGNQNEKAYKAFAFFAKTALNDYDAKVVDPNNLVGLFIRATVEHDVRESEKKEGATVTYVRLTNLEPADGFDEDETPAKAAEEPAPAKKKFDLKSVLG